MKIRITHIIFLMIFIILVAGAKPSIVSAQDPPSAVQSVDTTAPSIFEIPEKRFGGSMAEEGTWAVTTGLKIISTPQNQDLSVKGLLEIHSPGLAYHLKQKIIKGIFVLLIGERVFDGKGFYRYGQNILSSGFLTDTGFPIEGITSGLITDSFGGNIKHPINRLITIPPDDMKILTTQGIVEGKFSFDFQIPPETPPGWYRFSMMAGAHLDDKEFKTLWNEDPDTENLLDSEGTDFQLGLAPIGNPAQPYLPWVILPDYIPDGGILARQYKGQFAITTRTGATPRAVIPMMKPDGGQVQYNLEPAIPYLAYGSPLSLEFASGEIAIKIKTPKGNIIDLGHAVVKDWDGKYLLTREQKFNFAFSEYGRHEIEITGFIKDKNGIVIGGGGIYDIDVANKLEIVTSLPIGMPFKEKENVDVSLRVVPPVPAKIKVRKILNPWSQKGKTDVFDLELTCNEWGVYTPSGEEIKKRWTIPEYIRFSRSGEYRVDIVAEYKDKNGVLYIGSKTLGGVVTNDSNRIEIMDEDSEPKKTHPQTLEVIKYAPETMFKFDPDVKILLTEELKNTRILASDKTSEFPDGSIGCEPRSTASGFPAHWYPEMVDRRMYTYSAMSSTDGRTLFTVKDGGSMTDALSEYKGDAGRTVGDFFNFYNSMVLRDYPLDKVYYGTIARGALVTKSGAETQMPFMHSFTFFPGGIIEKDKPFVPRCLTFPPTAGIIKITLTNINGDRTFFSCIVDERGFLAKMIEEPIVLWQEGEYSVQYDFYPDLSKPEEVDETSKSAHTVAYPFYVVQNNKSNYLRWSMPSGSQVSTNESITMNAVLDENTLVEGKAYFALSFNSNLIEKGEVPFEGNSFEISINLPRLIEKIPNFNPKDPFDILEIGCMVKGVNPKGKTRFLASRITIHNGRLEY